MAGNSKPIKAVKTLRYIVQPVALIVLLIVATVACQDSAQTPTTTPAVRLGFPDNQGAVGDVIPIELILWNATDGVAGFDLTISVQNPDIAQITDVLFPAYGDPETGFGLTSATALPAQSITIRTVDLGNVLTGSFVRETLALIITQSWADTHCCIRLSTSG